ncbi:hypothetical protein [Haliangium sp.]|uniref:hypothetical protein n=1 Tax=Haliangium sp. TaxID=2663208 RepID=UPI003D095F44
MQEPSSTEHPSTDDSEPSPASRPRPTSTPPRPEPGATPDFPIDSGQTGQDPGGAK